MSLVGDILKGMETVTENSLQSLFLELMFDDEVLASGTGFVVRGGPYDFLVTARHNFTGRNQLDNKCLSATGGTPNKVRIWHNCSLMEGTWIKVDQSLLDEDEMPLWFEHPELGHQADLVALVLKLGQPILLIPYDLHLPGRQMQLFPTDPVSVVGFPFKVSVRGKLAIWTTGTIASEMAFDYEGMPRFLIDSRTRPGQSGAPVIAFRTGMARFKEGGLMGLSQPRGEFLGIYSGRINDESDLGIDWRREVIQALVESAVAHLEPS